MNIQGAEGLVIAGAEETLKKSKNIKFYFGTIRFCLQDSRIWCGGDCS